MSCVVLKVRGSHLRCAVFFFNDTATTEIYTLSLHDALPICGDQPDAPERVEGVLTEPRRRGDGHDRDVQGAVAQKEGVRVELDRKSTRLNSQSRQYLVCRLLLEKKNNVHPDQILHVAIRTI